MIVRRLLEPATGSINHIEEVAIGQGNIAKDPTFPTSTSALVVPSVEQAVDHLRGIVKEHSAQFTAQEPFSVEALKAIVDAYIKELPSKGPEMDNVKIRMGDTPQSFIAEFIIRNPTPEMIELARAMKEDNGKQP